MEAAELRSRKISTQPRLQDSQSGGADLQNEASASYSGPASTDFRSLIVTNTGVGNLALSLPSSPSTTLFYMKNTVFSPGKASLTVSSGSKTGPILGVMKIGHLKSHIVGLGDPAKADISWEDLKRTGGWKQHVYEFEFGVGRDRRRYIWERKKPESIIDHHPDLELREKVEGGGGEVLAVFRWCGGWKRNPKGSFLFPKRVNKGSPGDMEGEAKAWSDWEMMVLLTGLGIVVNL